MDFNQEPAYQPPSDFLRSAALFMFTMVTVFGLGMVWTNYGGEMADRWNKDWNGMKDGWAEATTPPEKKPGTGMFGLFKNSAWGSDGFGHEMRSADTSRLRSNQAVVPIIDTSKPKLKPVSSSRRR